MDLVLLDFAPKQHRHSTHDGGTMKKSIKKLSLNRETVRNLEDDVTREVLGRMPSGRVDCNGSLPQACDTVIPRACVPATVLCATA
jgi:hypothetical protein